MGVFPAASLRVVVGAACGVVVELDDPGDVKHVVEPAVPGGRQPVADVLAAGGINQAVPVQDAK
jgi:hypothetical protein